jgi:hypothetical protein
VWIECNKLLDASKAGHVLMETLDTIQRLAVNSRDSASRDNGETAVLNQYIEAFSTTEFRNRIRMKVDATITADVDAPGNVSAISGFIYGKSGLLDAAVLTAGYSCTSTTETICADGSFSLEGSTSCTPCEAGYACRGGGSRPVVVKGRTRLVHPRPVLTAPPDHTVAIHRNRQERVIMESTLMVRLHMQLTVWFARLDINSLEESLQRSNGYLQCLTYRLNVL